MVTTFPLNPSHITDDTHTCIFNFSIYPPEIISALCNFFLSFLFNFSIYPHLHLCNFFNSLFNSLLNNHLNPTNIYRIPYTQDLCTIIFLISAHPYQIMEKSTRKNKTKFLWSHHTFKEFIDACLLELRKGNRPGTHFNRAGWENIVKTMQERTGITLDQKQVKNKWEVMKKEWKLYDRLMRLETGIGGTRSSIDASPEWWDEKIKVDKDFAKFRGANLEIFETHYAPLFRDSVAVGDQTMTPLQFQNDSNMNVEGKGDSDDISLSVGDPLFPSFVGSCSGKRKKSKNGANKRSSKCKTSSLEDKIDIALTNLSTKSTQTFPPTNSFPTMEDCMSIVITFPGFEEGSNGYLRAVHVFIQKKNRDAFMYPPTHESKMGLLKLLLED